jgi:acyl-CoA hydrolase
VVSGVGGQYNFVAMAHALPEARSILCVRATRESRGEVTSSIPWSYGSATIPRHLRDIVVSEYGIADLRGRTDRESSRRCSRSWTRAFRIASSPMRSAPASCRATIELPML